MTEPAPQAVEPGPKTLLIQRYIAGDPLLGQPAAIATPVFTVEDEHDDGPAFFAHQALHADGVVCVEVSRWDGESRAWVSAHRQCDEGLDWASATGTDGL